MSDDLDLDMEVVGDDELDELGGGGGSDSEERSSSELEAEKKRADESDEPAGKTEDRSGRNKSVRWSTHSVDQSSGSRSTREPKGETFRLDDIPDDWKITSVGEAAKDGKGLVDGDWVESKDMDEDGEIQLVQLGHIGEGCFKGEPDRFVNREFVRDEGCTLLSEGDLLISRMQEPILRSCLLPDFEHDSIMAVDIARLQETDSWSRQFLKYLFNSRPIWKQGLAWASGTTRKRISRKNIEKIRLPEPPLPEQRKIASVLYAVDQAIQKTEEIIEQAKRVKRGLMQDLFEGGITESGRIRDPETEPDSFRQTPLGEVPKAWKMLPLHQACDEIVDSPHSTPEYADQGVLIIRTSDIRNGRFVPDEAKYVTEEDYHERVSRLRPESGDVVFTREAPVGEALKIPKGMQLCLGQRTMVFRTNEELLDPDFLVQSLYSRRVQKRFGQLVVGTTNPHLNVGTIRNFKLPVPSLEEQNRIVSVLRSVDSEIETELQVANRLDNLKKGLMQDLLTGEVRTADRTIKVLEEVQAHG